MQPASLSSIDLEMVFDSHTGDLGNICDQASQTVLIEKDVDTFWCRKKVTEFARELGFGKNALWELSIVVSELCSNILKFAGNGTIAFGPTENPTGIVIIARDEGPGIEDIGSAMKDGFSEGKFLPELGGMPTRGFGTGLGAIMRLTDRVSIENQRAGGSIVVAHKYINYKRRK